MPLKMPRYSIIALFVALLFSCEEIIEVEDISEDTLIVLAPTNDATITNGSINFSWEPVTFADRYQLQIAIPNFESPQQLVEDTLITTSEFDKVLGVDTYQWRVRAINSTYQTLYTTQNLNVEE